MNLLRTCPLLLLSKCYVLPVQCYLSLALHEVFAIANQQTCCVTDLQSYVIHVVTQGLSSIKVSTCMLYFGWKWLTGPFEETFYSESILLLSFASIVAKTWLVAYLKKQTKKQHTDKLSLTPNVIYFYFRLWSNNSENCAKHCKSDSFIIKISHQLKH